ALAVRGEFVERDHDPEDRLVACAIAPDSAASSRGQRRPSRHSANAVNRPRGRRRDRHCPPCARPSSNSSLDHRRSDARAAENGFAAKSSVNKSAKVVLEAGYNATIFLRMVSDRGGLATAKYLINSPTPSVGYTHLYERGRLDLTVEAMVVSTVRCAAHEPCAVEGECDDAPA